MQFELETGEVGVFQTLLDMINMIRKINPPVRIILDADGDLLKEGVKARPDFIKPNIAEAEALLGRKINTKLESEFLQAIKDIYGSGNNAKNIILSLGDQGVIALEGRTGKIFRCPAIQVEGSNVVGAGDAFVAGLAHALQKGKNFSEMLQFATALSAAKVTHHGVTMPSMAEVLHLFEEQKPIVHEINGH